MAYETEVTLLKEIEINTSGISASEFTAVNSTNVDLSKTDLDNIILQVGEVQAVPTQYSILDRLKTIESNTMNGSIKTFVINKIIDRPADTTSYTVGDIVSGNGVNIPLELDFSTFGNMANKRVVFQNLFLSTDKACTIFPIFFSKSTLGAQVFTDNSPFNPSLAEWDINTTYATMGGTASISTVGATVFVNFQTSKNVFINTDINSKVYFILCVDTAFTPNSAQKFNFSFKGTCYL